MSTLFDRADFLGERFDLETISLEEKGISIEINMVIPGNVLQAGNNETVMYLVHEMQKLSGTGVSTTYNGVDLKKGTATLKMIVSTKEMLHVEQSKRKYVTKSIDTAKGLSKKDKSFTICSVEGCGHPTKAKGLCKKHYEKEWNKRKYEKEEEKP